MTEVGRKTFKMAQILSTKCKKIAKLKDGLTSFRTLTSRSSEAYYDDDQKQMQKTLLKIIDNDINPFVDQWEKDGQYPAHEVFKKLGAAGLLGIDKVKSFSFFKSVFNRSTFELTEFLFFLVYENVNH